MSDPLSNFRLWTLALAALAVGVAHLWARRRGHTRAALWLKPLPVALALLVTLLAGWLLPPPVAPLYRTLIATGLLLSMAGDLLLAWTPEQFEAGLGAFLAAHLLYIAAFVSRAGFHLAPLLLAVLLLYGIVLMALLLPRVETVLLRGAVVLYTAALLAMAWQAGGMWQATGGSLAVSAALAFGGALFFIVSDSVLAWDRFRARLALVIPVVMATYYLAQWLLALSVLA